MRTAMWAFPFVAAAAFLLQPLSERSWQLGLLAGASALACACITVGSSSRPTRAALVTVPTVVLVVAVAIWNPWNLVVVNRLFAHPFVATFGLASTTAFVVVSCRPREGTVSRFHIAVGWSAVVVCLAVLVLMATLQGNWPGALVGMFVLAALVASDWRSSRWRAPVVTPFATLLTVAGLALPVGAALSVFDARWHSSPKNDGAIELISTDIDGGCPGTGYYLASGRGISARERLIQGLACHDSAELDGPSTLVLSCSTPRREERRLVLDPDTLNVVDDDRPAPLIALPVFNPEPRCGV